MKRINTTALALAISFLLLVLTQGVLAQGQSDGKGNSDNAAHNSDHGHGKNKNVGVGNASDGIFGSIITAKDIFYTGNPLDISLRFARGAELIADGQVDAYVVVFSPPTTTDDDTATDEPASDSEDPDASDEPDPVAETNALSDAVVLPVSSIASADSKKLFELDAVDVSALPAGTYQLGLILTNPGGDPLVINDWYRGLLGLIDVVGLTVSDEAVDFDKDGDGEVDDDDDGDGFSDDPDPDSDSDSSSDPDPVT